MVIEKNPVLSYPKPSFNKFFSARAEWIQGAMSPVLFKLQLVPNIWGSLVAIKGADSWIEQIGYKCPY